MRSMRTLALALVLVAPACGGSTTTQQGGTTLRELPPPAPEAVREFVAGARAMERRNGGQEAQQHLRQAVTLDPNLWEAHYDLGVLARREERLDDAIAAFEAARRIQPGSREVRSALAEAHYTAGHADRAIDLLEALVEEDPEDVASRVSLATLLRVAGRHDDALEQARAVLVRQPSNVSALLEVGRIYVARERYEVADIVLRKALDLVPRGDGGARAVILHERGRLELARGDTQAAFQAFGEANAADPRFRPAHRDQGAVLLRAGDYAGARAEFEALLRIDADDVAARVSLAIALRGQGDFRHAREELERVLAADPNQPEALFDLAILEAEFLNQRTEARDLFQRFLRAAPSRHPKRATAERYVADITAELAAPPPAPAETELPAEGQFEELPAEKGGGA